MMSLLHAARPAFGEGYADGPEIRPRSVPGTAWRRPHHVLVLSSIFILLLTAPLATSAASEAGTQGTPVIHIGEQLTVCVDDFSKMLADAGKAPLGLFLDDLWIADVPLERRGATANGCELIRFQLERTGANRSVWRRLLGRPGFRRTIVSVGIGTQDRSVFKPAGNARVVLWDGAKAVTLILIVLMLVAVGCVLAFKYNAMLRDYVTNGVKGPFSLGRVQMAWWTLHILVAFFLLWGATGAVDTLSPQVLVLMGISSATALGSVTISSSKEQEARRAVEKATSEKVEATRTKNDPESVALAQSRLAEAEKALVPPKAETFLADILTDVNGTSLHRLQVLLWTLTVTAVFWGTVWRDLEMPALSETILVLMGISAGTYLGFKIPEKQT